jgi:chorismate mutase
LAALKREEAIHLKPKCEATGPAFFVYFTHTALQSGGKVAVRGIRGAISVTEDRSVSILSATGELLTAILQANPGLLIEDIASVLFTVTDDLCSAYPAQAARQLGWGLVPLMCAREISVPGGLPHCVRVLVHWNTNLPQSKIHHIYLGEAASLRPDLAPEA